MKLITFNVNGIRSAINKGLIDWVSRIDPDILCLQEIKLSETEIVEPLFKDLGYYCYWYPAQKRGYSGVAILSKSEAKKIVRGFGVEQYDMEGRTILAEFEDFKLINAYFPSGTTGDLRQSIKMKFLDDFFLYANAERNDNTPIIVCGDVNICHREIDIHNPKSNAKTSGFLPEERAWVGKFIESGFIDTFRHTNKDPHHYTWWSYRAGSRGKNLGWRIDYIFAANLKETQLKNVHIHSDVIMSDHCPVLLDFNI